METEEKEEIRRVRYRYRTEHFENEDQEGEKNDKMTGNQGISRLWRRKQVGQKATGIQLARHLGVAQLVPIGACFVYYNTSV